MHSYLGPQRQEENSALGLMSTSRSHVSKSIHGLKAQVRTNYRKGVSNGGSLYKGYGGRIRGI